jgi:hypothetical protein
MQRPGAKIGVATAVMLLVAAVWWTVRRADPIDAAGRRAVDCGIAGDAACLLRFVMPAEKQALNLDEAKLRRFLESWYMNRFQVVSSEPYGYLGNPEADGKLAVSRKVRLKDGSEATVDLTVVTTDDGYKIPSLVTQLWIAAVLFPARADGKETRGPARYEILAQAATDEGPKLEALGIPGLVLDDAAGLTGWEGLARRFRSRAEKMRERTEPGSAGTGQG